MTGIYYNQIENKYGFLQWREGTDKNLVIKIEDLNKPISEWAEQVVDRSELGAGEVKNLKSRKPWKKVLYISIKKNKLVAQTRANGSTYGCDHHKTTSPRCIRNAVESQDKKQEMLGIEWQKRPTKGLHVHRAKQLAFDRQHEGEDTTSLRCRWCYKTYQYQKRLQMHECECESNPALRGKPRYCGPRQRLRQKRSSSAAGLGYTDVRPSKSHRGPDRRCAARAPMSQRTLNAMHFPKYTSAWGTDLALEPVAEVAKLLGFSLSPCMPRSTAFPPPMPPQMVMTPPLVSQSFSPNPFFATTPDLPPMVSRSPSPQMKATPPFAPIPIGSPVQTPDATSRPLSSLPITPKRFSGKYFPVRSECDSLQPLEPVALPPDLWDSTSSQSGHSDHESDDTRDMFLPGTFGYDTQEPVECS